MQRLAMVTANISRIDQARDFIGLLKSMQHQKIDADLTITSKYRQGLLHVREGSILSAHSGILHGNGAVLTLAQMEHSQIEITPASELVPRTVSISLEQIERFFSAQARQSVHDKRCDEEKLLQEAIDLFFRFEYKQAVEGLVTILRHNRFFYPAWLWQSRILTRQDYIARALDEAYRWGNHDQDVWREARKLRPHLSESDAPVKRCYYCWSILTEPAFCSHCHAHLAITGRMLSTDLRCDEINFALSHFTRALHLDKTNARIAFTLALGHFNLGENQRALNYMRLAANLSPQTPYYAKNLTMMMAVTRSQAATPHMERSPVSTSRIVQTGKAPTTLPVSPVTVTPALPRQRPVQTSSVPPSAAQTIHNRHYSGKSIFVIEDSRTSRKVLAMLLGRNGYRIHEASTGMAALQLAHDIQPDLVLLDVQLPDTTGYTILPQLKKIPHFAQLPVIMLTGKREAKDRMEGMLAGTNEYLTKPFDPQKLLSIINGYLQV